MHEQVLLECHGLVIVVLCTEAGNALLAFFPDWYLGAHRSFTANLLADGRSVPPMPADVLLAHREVARNAEVVRDVVDHERACRNGRMRPGRCRACRKTTPPKQLCLLPCCTNGGLHQVQSEREREGEIKTHQLRSNGKFASSAPGSTLHTHSEGKACWRSV